MTLQRLASALGEPRVEGTLAREITGIVHDSRCAAPGSLFVALRGSRTDGAAYVHDAIARGAAAVVFDRAHAAGLLPLPDKATALVVDDEARALSRLAAAFYDMPSTALRVVGVTGTNGKTTTTHMLAAILERAGIPAGLIGTLGAAFAGERWPLANTTPLADDVQRVLARMLAAGAGAVSMEVSSHALALGRVADVRFSVGVLTNVTRDHLDFHGSLEAYAAAKRSLFDAADSAVLNADDVRGLAWSGELRRRGARVLTFGLGKGADVRAEGIELGPVRTRFTVAGRNVSLRVPGRFNVANALAALCAARMLDVDDATSAAALGEMESVPGRMQRIDGGGFDVLVDYAHTPAALEEVLRAAQEIARGRTIVVFGCGGDRDRGKRAEMGAVAARLADDVVVTSDNPRSEDPLAIIDDVLAGAQGAASVRAIADRRAAIRAGVAAASAGDVLVVAGKGHEAFQVAGPRTIPFDDAQEVRAALRSARREGVAT